MPALILYLLKVGIIFAGFYALYYFLFRKEKQFLFNRFYLLFIFAAGFLIPLIILKFPGKPVPYPLVPGPVSSLNPGTAITVTANNRDVTGLLEDIALYGYCLLGLFLVIRLLLGYFSVYRIIRKGSPRILNSQEVVVTRKNVTPFSFFNKIIIPESLTSSPDLPAILEHEKVHIREWHTVDLLVAELAYIFQWFNPVAHYLKKAVRINLEYMADHKVISEFPDIESYQMAMVRLADKKPVPSLASALHVSQLKNRIVMMKKNNLNRFPIIKKLAILPLTLLIILLIAQKKYTAPLLPADGITIKGKVISAEDQKPIPRAVVYLKGNQSGVFTDLNGEFSIKSGETENTTLVISAVGYERKEVSVKGDQLLNIFLKRGDTGNQPDSPETVATEMASGNDKTESMQYKAAQAVDNITISGRVTSQIDDKPLPRVDILIKGRTDGTISDKNGEYRLEVNKNDKALVFSRPGYQTVEVEINNRKKINIAMNEGSNNYVYKGQAGKDDSIVNVNVKVDVQKDRNVVVVKSDSINKVPSDEILIKGKITSAGDHMPLGSMNVFIKGKTIGTISDENGNYMLRVKKDDKAILVTDPIGQYKKKEIDLEQNIGVNTNVNTEVNVEVPVEIDVELDPGN